jgi:hypothetical protein
MGVSLRATIPDFVQCPLNAPIHVKYFAYRGMGFSFKKFAVIHGRAWGSLFKNETSTARPKGHHFATAGGEVSQYFAFRLLGHQPP